MRRLPALLTAVGLAALTLAGCAAEPTSAAACVRPASDGASALDAVSVTGDFDAAPEVSVDGLVRVSDTVYRDVITGTGPRYAQADQWIGVDLTVINGTTGQVVPTPQSDGDIAGLVFTPGATQAIPGFADALRCVAEGSRVLVAFDRDDVVPEVATQFGLSTDDTFVAVFDVRKVVLPRAEGSLEFNAGFGLPSVVRATDGRPGVVVPHGAAPSEAVSQILIRGAGDQVTGDVPLFVHALQVAWDATDQAVLSSTWETGQPIVWDVAAQSAAIQQALIGVPVGSQVMVVEPAADGSEPSVWVVDVHGTVSLD